MIDSHAHLTSDSLFPDLNAILLRAKDSGITNICNICTDKPTLERGIALNEKFPWIVNSAASTPHDVEQDGESFFPLVEKAILEKKLVAIGETGLDYHYTHSPKELQKLFLIRYLHLAQEHGLPVVIHCRDAFNDLFSILDNEYRKEQSWLPGVLHCFTGTLEEAMEVIKRGWYLSLSGIVTFKKSNLLQEVAKIVPLEQLLVETDAPYLAPQSKRGKTNEPSFIKETINCIAKIKQTDPKTIISMTQENAKKLFNI